MPNYTFRNKETGEEFDLSMTLAEHEEFTTKNTHLTQVIKPLGVRDNFIAGTGIKPPEVFKDILREIAKVNKNHNMDI